MATPASVSVVNTAKYLGEPIVAARRKRRYDDIPFEGIMPGHGIVVRGTKKRPMDDQFWQWLRSMASNVGNQRGWRFTTRKIDENTVLIAREY